MRFQPFRKFSRRVQGTGLIKTVRANRYYARTGSKTVKKKRALKLIKRREEFRQAVKEGKVIEAPKRGNFNREQNSSNSSSGNSNSQSSATQNTQTTTISTTR